MGLNATMQLDSLERAFYSLMPLPNIHELIDKCVLSSSHLACQRHNYSTQRIEMASWSYQPPFFHVPDLKDTQLML
jgi:hypothetical protein